MRNYINSAQDSDYLRDFLNIVFHKRWIKISLPGAFWLSDDSVERIFHPFHFLL